MDASPRLTIDLDGLGFDAGAHLLVTHVLGQVAAGERVRVVGTDPHLRLHLTAWCRSEGHDLDGDLVRKGTARADRWRDAVRAGAPRVPSPSADPAWGLAARGALVEDHGPPLWASLVFPEKRCSHGGAVGGSPLYEVKFKSRL